MPVGPIQLTSVPAQPFAPSPTETTKSEIKVRKVEVLMDWSSRSDAGNMVLSENLWDPAILQGLALETDKKAVAAVAVEMWTPAFGAGFQAPRANQESQVTDSSFPPSARHFHSKAANSAHFLRN
jgi:hypothetical protein